MHKKIQTLKKVNFNEISLKILLAAKEEKKVVQLVDLKRANNVGILLSRIKVPVPEIKDAINSLDEDILSLENSRALLRLAPSPDEIDMLKK